MTAWEIQWCDCLEQCRALLKLRSLRQDTKEFVEGVYQAMNAYPRKYPTEKQAYWIRTLHRQHCRKEKREALLV